MGEKKYINFLKIQSLVFIYSLVSLFSKISSNFMKAEGFFSVHFISSITFMFFLLTVYAFFWQKILKNNDLSFAYVNKATQLLWSIVWSIFVFKEGITIPNIIGTLIVIFGVYMVNRDV